MSQTGVHIDFSCVGFTYGRGNETVEALRNMTFSIKAGESVALIGPSGCGKSTTLHLLAGLLLPSKGKLLIDNVPINAPRRATAFIQQDFGLFPWKTVLQNAEVGLQIRKTPKAEAVQRARAALARVGIEDSERLYPKDLSGGMRQRLALARALAMDADLVLMDEPLSAIDALLREFLQDDLLELWHERGYTQIVVTHSVEEAVFLGRRILVCSARPAAVVNIIDNSCMGSSSYRATAEYLVKCQEVRNCLAISHSSRKIPALVSQTQEVNQGLTEYQNADQHHHQGADNGTGQGADKNTTSCSSFRQFSRKGESGIRYHHSTFEERLQ